jgi:hypothetical protein
VVSGAGSQYPLACQVHPTEPLLLRLSFLFLGHHRSPLSITLIDWKIWESYATIIIIHLSWCTYVVSQSVVLYSRLNLVLQNTGLGRYVLWMIMINSVVFGLGTVVVGLIAVSTLSSTSASSTLLT